MAATTYLNPISSSDLVYYSKNLNTKFNLDQLKEITYAIINSLGSNIQMSREALPKETADLPIEAMFNGERITKATCCQIISFILADVENFKIFFNSLPDSYKKAIKYIAEDNKTNLTVLRQITGDRACARIDRSSWKETVVFDGRLFMLQADTYYESVKIIDFCKSVVLKTLAAGIKEIPDGIATLPEIEELKVYSNGDNFLNATNILFESLKQGWLAFDSKYKLNVQNLKKVIKLSALSDFFPNGYKKELFTSPTSLAIAIYSFVVRATHLKDPTILKDARWAISYVKPELIANNFFPFISGFYKAEIWRYEKLFFGYIERFMGIIGHSTGWISFDEVIKSMTHHKCGCVYTISLYNSSLFGRYDLTNKTQNDYIDNENCKRLLDAPFLKLFASALSVMGIIDIAYSNYDPTAEETYEFIRYFKLTELGEYVFKRREEYTIKKTQIESRFEVDDERLIIRSISEENPYISFLDEIAVSIGANRYQVNSKTMLNTCSCLKDLEEKISTFKRFVCPNPPKNWEDFFCNLRQCVKPLKSVGSGYYLFELEATNKTLLNLLNNNLEIRKLFLKAEGYKILIKDDNYDKFKKLMKANGYII